MNSAKVDIHTIYKNPQPWFTSLPKPQQELFKQSIFLINDAHSHKLVYTDYSYIIMPASKSYEGFIKDLLLKLKLITQNQHSSKRFRVGKALNPQLESNPRYKREALYNELSQFCSDQKFADSLWNTWIECRNKIFHYFPTEVRLLDLSEAEQRVTDILQVVMQSYSQCNPLVRVKR
jgi:hypothetical protein